MVNQKDGGVVAPKPPTDKGSTSGQKESVPVEPELSEEDKQLQDELEMLVKRLSEGNIDLYIPALEGLRTAIRSATTSMTSVPKPLKFLRKHYDELKTIYERMSLDTAKRFTADIVSVLAMTMPPPEQGQMGDSLKYRLLGSREEIGSWGHEYVRHLAGEVANEWNSENVSNERREELTKLVQEMVPYHMKHNAEAEAADLLMEIERLDLLDDHVTDEETCSRVCLYLTSCVSYVPDPENTNLLKAAARILLKFNKYPEALRLTMQLQDIHHVKNMILSCPDPSVQKQMAFMVGRQQYFLSDDSAIDSDLVDIMSNSSLNNHFLALGRELDILEPKLPEDIYKSHLESSSRPSYGGNIDSARANLASSFVNGFVNCGFGKDKLLQVEEGNKWLYKHKESGMMSATASLGLILLWDVDSGLTQIDKYLYSSEDHIKAGALLACGLVNSGVRNDCDPALALLAEYVSNPSLGIKTGAIIGLALAYAGTNRSDVIETLLPVMHDPKSTLEVIGITALASGLIAVGSANSDVTTACLTVLLEKDADGKSDLKTDTFSKYLSLACALCYLRRQDEVETMQAALQAISDEKFREMSKTLVDVCAYAATGNVLKIQQLLHICSEKKSSEVAESEPVPTSGTSTSGTSTSGTSTSGTVGGSSSGPSTTGTTSAKVSSSTAPSSQEAGKEGVGKEAPKTVNSLQQSVATIGIALIAMAEDIGSEMAFRSFGHLLRYGDVSIKRSVPLALALTSVSNPKLNILETLSKFSHDPDQEVAVNSILAMGFVGAGTNNARLATMLRQLAQFHAKDPNCLFATRISQGLTHLGKGTLTLSPFHSDRQLLVPTALGGLLVVLFSLLDVKTTILGKFHYLLYFLTPAIQPRMLVTFDEDLQPLPVSVRVGQAVDVVGQAGKPKTITGFQTHTTPVLLALGERAELATDQYLPLTPILEGFVILKKNPDYQP